QKVTYGDNSVRIEGKTFLYFDAEGNPITEQAHGDSLETHRYIISIKGTDEIPEIHLVYKHPKLETLIGKILPKIDLNDINGKSIDFDESEYTVICFWNRHCRICIRELVVLDILAEDYSNVQFVGLTPDSPEEVHKLMKRLKLEWEDIEIVPNYNEEFTDILKIYMYPSNVIVDKNMVVKAVNVGGDTRKLLRTLEQLSGEK
ncbi:redoxin domain-containing protein, partial [Bacteroides caecimuris]